MNFFMNEKIIERNGNLESNIGIHDLFPCKGFDSWIALVIESNEDWNKFCSLSELPNITEFNTNKLRIANRAKLTKEISQWTKKFDKFNLPSKDNHAFLKSYFLSKFLLSG